MLPEYQLVVVNGDHFDDIIYKGPETEKPFYLYYHSGHYDIITWMPVFLGRAYFCLTCKKGYNTEDWRHHPCTTKCSCCQHTACPNQREISSWISCAQCYRMFKGPGCLENHQRAGVSGGKSLCQLYTKFQKCDKVVDVSQKSQGKHKCREVRCPTCQTTPKRTHVSLNPSKRKVK